MSETGHSRWHEELGAYALGTLEPETRDAFERHLAECRRCREELRWLEPAVAALPLSVRPKRPPRRLRRNLMARARADLSQEGSGQAAGRAGRIFRPALAGLAAVLAVVVALLVLDGGSGDVESTPLQVTAGQAAGASAVLRVDGGQATLIVERMPRLRGGDVYQAWISADGALRPSSVFAVNDRGEGATVIEGLEDAEGLLVTREPAGGSLEPSSAPLLRAVLD